MRALSWMPCGGSIGRMPWIGVAVVNEVPVATFMVPRTESVGELRQIVSFSVVCFHWCG